MASSSKPEYPPQGGEARLCFTVFVAMVLSIMSAVTIIYSTVIVYFPALKVLESNMQGQKICTSLKVERRLQGAKNCQGWSSCEEWCLGMSKESCGHVHVSVRDPGIDLELADCAFEEPNFIDHTCKTTDELEELNCKLEHHELDENNKRGDKEICKNFNNIQLSCVAGLCKNISSVYDCNYKSKLQDIKDKNSGAGECYCEICDSESSEIFYGGTCPEKTKTCMKYKHNGVFNATMENRCSSINCFSCRQICHEQVKCFDMWTRRDPPGIGKDQYERPKQKYYDCEKGHCWEIYDLQCERRCEDIKVDLSRNNIVLFNNERIVSASCDSTLVQKLQEFTGDFKSIQDESLLMQCTSVQVLKDQYKIEAFDCINGVFADRDLKDSPVSYAQITKAYAAAILEREQDADIIPHEQDLMIANETRLMVNMEGCVNTLRKECTTFYEQYGKDGRNNTSPSIYPCFFDSQNPEFAVIDFDQEFTLMLLIFCSAVPFAVLLASCGYICLCNKVVQVAKDGRMRMICCGKYVTGIGNVDTRFDPLLDM